MESAPVPELSLITNCVVDYLFATHGHRITGWNHNILSPAHLQSYADAVAEQGAPLSNCFGFIDGTVRPISRPIVLQEAAYNGHKRVHSIKFQSVTIPTGLIANLFGPVGKYSSVFKFLFICHRVSDCMPGSTYVRTPSHLPCFTPGNKLNRESKIRVIISQPCTKMSN